MTTKPNLPAFIPAKLDDYGLTPAQFRVYGHLSRRGGSGEAFASVPGMARVCRLEQKTVRESLIALVGFGMINKQIRPGQTTVYRISAMDQWAEPLPNGTSSAKREDTPAKQHQPHPSQTAPDEGNPSEGTPMKGETSPPINAASPAENKQKLFPREYDNLIHEAKCQIRELIDRPGPGTEATIAELKAKIRQWKCDKLGIARPAPTPTEPRIQSTSAAKPSVNSFADIPRDEFTKWTGAMRDAVDKGTG
jgi:hypothetical protein